jgi:hypothetical protein
MVDICAVMEYHAIVGEIPAQAFALAKAFLDG